MSYRDRNPKAPSSDGLKARPGDSPRARPADSPKAPPVDGKVQVQIGRRLRSSYEVVLHDGLTDRMKSLLDALDRIEEPEPADMPPPAALKTGGENRA